MRGFKKKRDLLGIANCKWVLKVQELGSFLFLISGFPFLLGKMSHIGVDTSEMSHVTIAGKCLLLRDVRRHQAKIGYAEVENLPLLTAALCTT